MYIKCNSICHTDVPNLIQPRSSKASLTACILTNWISLLSTGVETRNTDLNWLDWTLFVWSAYCVSFVKSVRLSSTHKNLNNIQYLIQYSFSIWNELQKAMRNVLYLVPLYLPDQTKHYLLLLIIIKCIIINDKMHCEHNLYFNV